VFLFSGLSLRPKKKQPLKTDGLFEPPPSGR